jgi:glyoxylase-like metal-dependent hydrolase (beta-lactamase superfamily II)
MAVKIPPTDALLFLVSDKNNSILTTKSTGQRFYYPAGYTELPTFALKNFNYTNDNELVVLAGQTFDENFSTLKRSTVHYLSLINTPPFGAGWRNANLYCFFVELDSFSVPEYSWINKKLILTQFYNYSISLTPESKYLIEKFSEIENNTAQFIEIVRNGMKNFELGITIKLEYAPYIQNIPIDSNTLTPFDKTNLLIFGDGSERLIADPGANEKGKEHFRKILQNLKKEGVEKLKVFITHLHRDHIEGLDVVEQLYPDAELLGHKKSLDKINSSLKKIAYTTENMNEAIKIQVGTMEIEAYYTPGHTDGHMILFDKKSRIMAAGDHLVGSGSSILDPEAGGDMIQYLNTTEFMKGLLASRAIPAHGGICWTPNQLLQLYIDHRKMREELVLEAYNDGKRSLDDITKAVYADINEKMLPWAKRNVYLHLLKLQHEGAIDPTIDYASQKPKREDIPRE